jgi:hypothetical protein
MGRTSNKTNKIQAIADMLQGHGITLKQATIEYLYRKDAEYLNSVIRGINSTDNAKMLSLFSSIQKTV